MWKLVYNIGRDKHKIVRHTERPGKLYIMDNSGENPDATDDGASEIDMTRALRLGSRWHSVPVKLERDASSESWVGTNNAGALWLIENTDIRVDMDPVISNLQKVLRAWERRTLTARRLAPKEES